MNDRRTPRAQRSGHQATPAPQAHLSPGALPAPSPRTRGSGASGRAAGGRGRSRSPNFSRAEHSASLSPPPPLPHFLPSFKLGIRGADFVNTRRLRGWRLFLLGRLTEECTPLPTAGGSDPPPSKDRSLRRRENEATIRAPGGSPAMEVGLMAEET